MACGLASGFKEASAEGLSTFLNSAVARGALQAQSNGGAESPEPTLEATDGPAQDDVPFSELNEALSAARARLAELTKAAEIAKVASELREQLEATKAENQRLKAALSEAQSDNAELQAAQQAAARLADERRQAASDATEEARRLDEELVAMRWQNSQLSTSLARAETSAREGTEELSKAKSELSSQVQALSATAEKSATEITRLQTELDATTESALIAEQRGAALEEQLALRNAETDDVKAETTKLATDLDKTITELSDARAELTSTREALDEVSISLVAANQEAAVLREQVATNREEADHLRKELETAQAQIRQVNASNKNLQRQVGALRTAAGEATDAARLNLIAVENRINEINAALATVKGEELLTPDDEPTPSAADRDLAAAENENGQASAGIEVASVAEEIWVPEPTPARAAAEPRQQQLIAAASPTGANPERTNHPPAASSPFASRVVQTSKDQADAAAIAPTEVAALITGLSDEGRQRAETLLVDLDARSGTRGLTMTVPGTILFAVNSEKIEPDAYDTLAKVAEIVDLYDDRDVLIVGHTDAVGDDGYNQKLSERRADLVRNYFVDEFKIGSERLSIEGQGEKHPITSNATSEGRDSNRRIEVIILE